MSGAFEARASAITWALAGKFVACPAFQVSATRLLSAVSVVANTKLERSAPRYRFQVAKDSVVFASAWVPPVLSPELAPPVAALELAPPELVLELAPPLDSVGLPGWAGGSSLTHPLSPTSTARQLQRRSFWALSRLALGSRCAASKWLKERMGRHPNTSRCPCTPVRQPSPSVSKILLP